MKMRLLAWLPPIPLLLPAAGLLLAFAAPVHAQEEERSLHWDSIHVEARLDGDGRLHVRELQTMVFDGAWNGGERRLPARMGQRLRFEGIARVDAAAGREVPLSSDEDVDDVDEYDRDDSRLRWRSRLEDDPPFDGDTLTYRLDYVIENAVLPVDSVDDRYLLDYDFLFADRAGPVERFTLELGLDRAWALAGTPPSGWQEGERRARMTAVDIPPGRGYALRLPLDHVAPGAPATVPTAPSPWLRWSLIVLLLGGSVWMVRRFLDRARAAGRFEPLPEVPDEAWLEEHVLAYPPELVGAAWDRSTSAPEVAGLLARLVQEGKLASRVEPAEKEGKKPVLHLELKVPRDRFDELERPLIDALFYDGRKRTDTKSVKEHYEKKGFDPAGKIREGLDRRVEGLPGAGEVRRGAAPAWLALAGAGALLLAAVIMRATDAVFAGLAAVFIMGPAMIAMGIGWSYSRAVTRVRGYAVGMLVPLGVVVLGAAAFLAGGLETTELAGGVSPYYRPGPVLLLAVTLVSLAAVAVTLRMSRPTETPERLRFRRRLAAARAHFEGELERTDPDLRDPWFPWLLAFGLGPRIDQWFESSAAATDTAGHTVLAATAAHAATSGGSSGAGSGFGSAWTGGGATFGGGGGFSGGGVGGSWSVAATTVASGVASPSSGGTAGGVASAGGGGGGGW